MVLEVLQENLSHALSIVSRVLESKPQMAVLSNILLQTKDGRLEITASNLETTVTTQIGAKIESDGALALPGRLLTEIVSSLPAQKISFSASQTNLTLKSESFTTKIGGVPATEYPPQLIAAAQPSSGNKLELSKSNFQKLVSQTAFAASLDESRAALTGVLFKLSQKDLFFVATDGFRLSRLIMASQSTDKTPPSDIIVPSSALFEATRLLSEKKEKGKENLAIYLFPDNNQILFDFDDTKIYSRLIAGNFPDFDKIIPTSSEIKVELATEELNTALRLASVFARESANIIKLQIEKSKLKISANAPSVGENESLLSAKIEGSKEEFTIAFNFRYLQDFLNCTSSPEITIEFSTPTSPGVFRLKNDPDFLHLIMPVRVQG